MAKNTTKSDAEREARLSEVAELYLRGWLQAEIAQALEVSQQQISYDLKKLKDRWAASADRDTDALLAQELAKLDHLEATYWEAWERSIEARRTRTAGSQTGGRETGKRTTSVKEEDLLGDPRYLAGIERCIQQRCKLVGIEAPQKIAPTDPSGKEAYDPVKLSSAERLNRITQLFDAAAASRAANAA